MGLNCCNVTFTGKLILEGDETRHSLYLGSAKTSQNQSWLQLQGIVAVLNVTPDIKNHYPSLFTYKKYTRKFLSNCTRIPVDDGEYVNLRQHFEEAHNFIHENRKQGEFD